YDIIVITNGPELSELMDRGWLTPLDHSRLTTFARNAGPLVRDPPWDRGNRFTVAWQSGITGIAYRPEAVRALGREPSSLHDLWDPALAGRVGMLRDLMDLGSAGLLSLGIDPQTSTTLGWQRAAEALRGQRDAGLVRGYYDQGYLWALQTGRTWISQAWSGDIFQANQLGHPELRFVVPEEGAMLWTDNMMIPVTARHPLDALTYMDFVYRPEIAAMIADWVWYMTPVPASRSIIADVFHDQPVADSPLVFPGRDLLGEPWSYLAPDAEGRLEKHTTFLNSRLRNYYVFGDAAEYRAWRRLFEPIAAGA
ncbi:MAG: spermidine/putrescine ABC transporter substrate-binding protein, partial [Candidatus Velamenicoccus archaeovorus]